MCFVSSACAVFLKIELILLFFLTLHENVSHASFHLSSPHCQSHLIPRPFFCPAFMSTSEINKPCYFAASIRTRSCPYNFFGTTCSLGAVLICTQIGVFLGSLRFTLSKNFPKAAHLGHPVLSAQSSPVLCSLLLLSTTEAVS